MLYNMEISRPDDGVDGYPMVCYMMQLDEVINFLMTFEDEEYTCIVYPLNQVHQTNFD